MDLTALMAALGVDPKRRLRWRVLRELGVAPWERRAKRLGDAELVRCAVHLLLDARPERAFADGGENEGFDEAKFEELRQNAAG